MARRTAKVDLSSVDRKRLQEILAEREYKLLSVNQITPNPYNKNSMGQQYYAALKANLVDPQVGFTIPILVRPNPNAVNGFGDVAPYMIIDGEHRWKAAKEVGYEEIPCIVFKPMNESLVKYLMVESNAVHGTTSDDDIKSILKSIETDLEGMDIYAMTITDPPIEDAEKYGLTEEEIEPEKDKTTAVTLYLTDDQLNLFRKITGQIRLARGVVLEAAVMECVSFFEESTGFGTIAKEGEVVDEIE